MTVHSRALRWTGLILGGIVALFLVGRGVAEFFGLRYSDPASYRNDWGGPSLPGVLAVHSGPALVIVTGTAVLIWRRYHERHGRRPARSGRAGDN